MNPEDHDVFRAQAQRGFLFRRMTRHLAKLIPPDRGKGWARAAGNADCRLCGLQFQDHPEAPEGIGLNILCDGRRVKL
jgi:hypothetical protein